MVLPIDPLLRVKLAGLRVTAHVSTLVLLALIVGGALSRLTHIAAGLPGLAWIAVGLVTWLAICAMLVAHEAVRVWACRRQGVDVPQVDFYVFGGLPRIRDEKLSQRSETLAGLAGLATLAAVAAGIAGGALLTRHASAYVHIPFEAGLIACTGLAILHLLPAVPLDGGRILRAWLWYLTDDLMVGTRAVALYAHAIAFGLVIGGLLLLPAPGSRPFWGLWVAIAGWQVASAARAVLRWSLWEQNGSHVTLQQVIAATGRRLSAAAVIDDVVDTLLAAGPESAFLVADGTRVVGTLRLADLRRLPRAEWADHRVSDVMTPIGLLPRLDETTPIPIALDFLDDAPGRIALVERRGRPIAVLTADQLALHIRGLNPEQPPPATPR